jgi:hypothetical protein
LAGAHLPLGAVNTTAKALDLSAAICRQDDSSMIHTSAEALVYNA